MTISFSNDPNTGMYYAGNNIPYIISNGRIIGIATPDQSTDTTFTIPHTIESIEIRYDLGTSSWRLNDSGSDMDFRVEGNAELNLFGLDATNNIPVSYFNEDYAEYNEEEWGWN